MRKCKDCKTPEAHPATLFGLAIGYYCRPCYRHRWEQAHAIVKSQIRSMTESVADAVDRVACDKCGDNLTGHEDDSATHCRWCVTCIDSAHSSDAVSAESK